MSQQVTKADIDSLISALTRLSVAIERGASLTSSSSTSSSAPCISIAGWEIVEPSFEQPFAVELDSRRVFEDGPQPIPPALLTSAAQKLSNVAGDPKERIVRAWKAGFWCWAAIATHSEYLQREAISVSDTQWIIFYHSRISGAVRVRKITELRSLLASQVPNSEPAVWQGFASLTEVQVCCASFGTDVPPLYQCSGPK